MPADEPSKLEVNMDGRPDPNAAGRTALLDDFLKEAQQKCQPGLLTEVLDGGSNAVIYTAAGAGLGSGIPMIGTTVRSAGHPRPAARSLSLLQISMKARTRIRACCPDPPQQNHLISAQRQNLQQVAKIS
jgi:hypothetical protein